MMEGLPRPVHILRQEMVSGAVRADPTFYLTTAGLCIDPQGCLLNENREPISGLYAAGDVCGSIEEKDGKKYGMGFDAALTYGYAVAGTLVKEL